MNYKDLSEISNNLRKSYENVEKIYSFGFIDDDRLKNNFKNLENALERIEDIPNFIDTKDGAQALAKSDKETAGLKKLSSSLVTFTNSLLSYFSLIENTRKVEKLLDEDKLDNDKLKNIVKSTIFDLNNYAKIDQYGQVDKNEGLESISHILYKIIKIEIRKLGYSELLMALEKIKLAECIDQYIEEDLPKSKNLPLPDLLQNRAQKMWQIALNENGFIDEVKSNLDKKRVEYRNDLREYEKLNSKRKANHKVSGKNAFGITGEIAAAIGRILPFILSISIVVTANMAAAKDSKSQVNQYVSYYSTVDGDYERYDELLETVTIEKGLISGKPALEGDVIIKEYGETQQDGTKMLKVYKASENFDNLEDYLSVDLENEELLYVKQVTLKEVPTSYTSEETVTEVARINSVTRNTGYAILDIFMFNLIALVADLIVTTGAFKFEYMTILKLLVELISDGEIYSDELPHGIILEAIDNIKNILKHSDGKNVNMDKLKELKEEVKISLEKYQQEYNKYSYLEPELNNAGFTKKLKK